MSESFNSKFLDDPQFQSLLVACLESLQRGEVIDRDSLAKDYPQYAAEVHQFLEDRQLLEQVASELQDVDSSNVAITAYEKTLGAQNPGDFELNERIRYIGEYEILNEVARGGMGIVFKAKQQSLGRVVALKMILSGRLADDGDVERFQREAKAAGRLKHSHIVPVHEIGEFEGRQYFTMDFVDGQSLAEIIRDETLAPKRAASLIQMVAEAVDYAHERDIVHRDLKPANILIDAHGDPQITDFGLAKILESVDDESKAELTASGQILGTPSYMSPEQASGSQDLVGPASDIYSLGAILYAGLTGRAPFVADSPVDTLLQVIHNEPVSPRDLNPVVPKDLETICLKCLSKERKSRYGSAQELADDLKRFCEGRPVHARPVSKFSKLVRWCGRNQTVASLLALVMVSMFVGTTISVFYANAANEYAKSEAAQHRAAEEARAEAEAQRDAANRARKLAVQRGNDLRRQLYVAQMPRALEEWQSGNTAGTKHLLAQHIPDEGEEDLRGFEWHWLDHLTRSSRIKIETGRRIVAADISPSGELIATVGEGKLVIHRLDNGEQTHEFQVPGAGVSGVSFDSSGDYLAVGHAHLQLWSLKDESLVWERPQESNGYWVAITSDNRLVLSASVEWGDGSGHTQIQMRDFETGTLVREIAVPSAIFAAKLNPTSHSIAANCYDDKVRIWDVKSGMLVKEFSQGGSLNAISYSPDGRWLTLGTTDGTIIRCDVLAGTRVNVWRKQPNSFRRVATAPDGRSFAAVGAPQIVYLYDFKTGEPVSKFRGHTAEINHVQFRPGTQEVVTCDLAGVIHAWDTRQEQGFVSFDGAPVDLSSAEFSNDGRWLARAEGISWKKEQKGVVRLHNLNDSSSDDILDGHEGGVFGVAIANGRLYSAGYDGRLICWDLASREELDTRTFEQPLTSLAVSEDGETKAVGTIGGTLLVLHGELEASVQKFSLGWRNWEIQHVDLSPDGRFLAANNREDLFVWDLDRNRQVVKLRSRRVSALAFNKSGDLLAAGTDGHVLVYDTKDWEVVHELKAHSEPVLGISFHPSGKQLVTRSSDATVKIWEMTTWQNVLSLSLNKKNRNDLFAPAFSPDGSLLLVSRQGDEAQLLTTKTIERKQEPDPEFLKATAEALTRRQRWEQAFHTYEQFVAIDPVRYSWDNALAAFIASYIGPNERTQKQIRRAAELGLQFRDQDILAAATLVHCAQLLPNMDPHPEESLEVVRQAWDELGTPASVKYLHTLFRQAKYAELDELVEQHRRRLKINTQFKLLYAGALYRLGRVDEANKVFIDGADSYGSEMPPLGKGRIFDSDNYIGILAKRIIFDEVSPIAAAAIEKALESRPNDASLLAQRGYLHRYWHRWEEALKDLQRAAELEPDNVEYWKAAAICATLANHFDKADRLAKQSIQIYYESNNTDEFWSAARIASRIPNATCMNDDLLEETWRSAQLRPNFSWREMTVASVMHRLGYHDNALELLHQLETKHPNYNAITKGAIQFRRGLILYDQGNVEEATKALIRGEALGSSSMQPPGIFPKRGQETFVDFIALGKELKNLLDRDSQSQPNQTIVEEDGSNDDSVRRHANPTTTEQVEDVLNGEWSGPSNEDQLEQSSDRSQLNSVFIYGRNKLDAEFFRKHVKPYRIDTEIIAAQDLSSEILSDADLVVIGRDTADAWKNSSESQMIRNAQIPVLAMGQGGYRFFGGLELEIGSPHGNHGTTSSLRPDEEAIFWDAFQPKPVDGVHKCYTEAQCISIELAETSDDVFPIASEADRENLYPLIAQKPYYFFWGFDGQLDQLTRTGRHLLPWACYYTVAMKRNPDQAFDSVSDVRRLRSETHSKPYESEQNNQEPDQ